MVRFSRFLFGIHRHDWDIYSAFGGNHLPGSTGEGNILGRVRTYRSFLLESTGRDHVNIIFRFSPRLILLLSVLLLPSSQT